MDSVNISEQVTEKGKAVTIAINGPFDINLGTEFISALSGIPPNVETITVDLVKTRFLGMSALGMLLPLRRLVDQNKSDLILANCNPTIKTALCNAGFNRLFTIQ